MGMMVDGVWKIEGDIPRENGRFRRSTTSFRGWISSDTSTEFPAEAGRYHLYVAWACPWAHRTAILRRLKGLEGAIGLSAVGSFMGEDGWAFYDEPGVIPDDVNGARFLREVYAKADPGYTGRVTTPVLWDKERETVVNNESREIIRMLDTEFGGIADSDADFFPEDLRAEIDATIDEIYEPINNGVYRSGFATTQEAYEEAVTELFDALDHWERVLGARRYLCGDRITEADWSEKGWVNVLGTGGALRFRPGAGPADPFGRSWELEGDPRALDLDVSGGELRYGDYPDALERLWGCLPTPRCGDLVLSAEPGYTFGELSGGYHKASDHGSLHADDSQVFVLAGGFGEGERAPRRITDVAPMLLDHFGAGTPAEPSVV